MYESSPPKPLATKAVMVAKQQQNTLLLTPHQSQAVKIGVVEADAILHSPFKKKKNQPVCIACLCKNMQQIASPVNLMLSPSWHTYGCFLIIIVIKKHVLLRHNFINALKFKTHRKGLGDC